MADRRKRAAKKNMTKEALEEDEPMVKRGRGRGRQAACKAVAGRKKEEQVQVKEELQERDEEESVTPAVTKKTKGGAQAETVRKEIKKESTNEDDQIEEEEETNIQFNKYYLIQLLEDNSRKSNSVWMQWGRVGANGQNSLQACGGDLSKAINIFKKFSDKTKNEWELQSIFEKVPGKYDLLKMDYSKGKLRTALITATTMQKSS
ncbi:Poly [ADP-ribose] polymerase 2 [Portunus trituberculatus]|uniref:NAD(+) ADP-ribosyltransferase n=1 Tax=Portunus trituberculatus TaxID=210409 RepID=A0A5B7D2W4_PORTR|nr:Poly [ADP-ribose] polymerase 2 [Portunus trituberculatus]